MDVAGVDDFNDATARSLPAAFPKGYAAFYIMKYEISQEQYVGFLNKLTQTQQTARTGIQMTLLGFQWFPSKQNPGWQSRATIKWASPFLISPHE